MSCVVGSTTGGTKSGKHEGGYAQILSTSFVMERGANALGVARGESSECTSSAMAEEDPV